MTYCNTIFIPEALTNLLLPTSNERTTLRFGQNTGHILPLNSNHITHFTLELGFDLQYIPEHSLEIPHIED